MYICNCRNLERRSVRFLAAQLVDFVVFLAKLFGGVSALKGAVRRNLCKLLVWKNIFFCNKQCTFVIVETWSVGVFAFLVLKL